MSVVELKKEAEFIYSLTINRPESMNALNTHVLAELNEFLVQIDKMSFSEIRCLIVTGAGEKAFVAGADIKEIADLNMQNAHIFAEKGQSIFRRLEKLKIPVIAAVNGFALGGGLELALACDFIMASENAKFGLPEVTLGLIPGFGGTVRLARTLSLSKAKSLIYSGEMLSAQEALNLGLAAKVCPANELMASALKMAQTIAQRAPLAVAHAKASINEAFDQPIEVGMKTESQNFSDLFDSKDVREGTRAFIEKRKAQFQGV
jgi:enoyl-CoA hydratase